MSMGCRQGDLEHASDHMGLWHRGCLKRLLVQLQLPGVGWALAASAPQAVGGRGLQSPGPVGRGQTGSNLHHTPLSPSRSFRPQPLWRKVLSAAVLGVPLLLGARYFTAEPQEKRRMRLVVDGVGRFGR